VSAWAELDPAQIAVVTPVAGSGYAITTRETHKGAVKIVRLRSTPRRRSGV